MPPDRPLPPSVLAALGLLAGCASSACLMMAQLPETGQAETGDTAEPDVAESSSGATAPAPLPSQGPARPGPSVFERLEAEGVLPVDVLERLSSRR